MSKPHILVTDDDSYQRQATVRLLERAGYEVSSAENGVETLRTVRTQRPDLLLLDVVLPDMDGLQVCRQIKADPALASTWVVMLSASKSDTEAQAEGLEAGADGYIARPLSNRELIARVQAMLRIKQTEEALSASEEHYRSLFDYSLNGIAIHRIVVDERGKPVDYIFLEVNPAFEAMTGLKAQDILGKPVTQVLLGIGDDPFIETFGRVALTGEPARFEQFATALIKYYDITAFSMRQGRFATIFRDITGYKQAEAALQRMEIEYRTLAENSPDLIARFDKNLRHMYVNPAAARAGRLEAGEYIGRTIRESRVPENVARVWEQHIRQALETGQVVEVADTFPTPDGNQHFYTHFVPERAPDGSVQSILSVARNVTAQKRAEEATHISLEQVQQKSAELEALLAGARAVLRHREFRDAARAIFDVCKALIGVQAGYVAMLAENGTENEALFLDAGGLPRTIDPALPMPIRGLRAEAYHTGQAVYDNDFSHSQWAASMPDSHVPLENVLFAPLVLEQRTVGWIGLANKAGGFDANDARMAGAFGELASIALLNSRTLEALHKNEQALRVYSEQLQEMVEERTQALKQAHEQLVRRERLAVLGQLSGSIAHELRTPLGAIKNAAYLLQMVLENIGPDAQEALEILNQEIVTSEQIINNLLGFARTRQPQKQRLVLNPIVNQALERIFVPEQVVVQQRLSDLPPIAADPVQLDQVVDNVLRNAIQAMPAGGKLTIRTYTSKPGWVAISVADTGMGIPPENLETIFEPLFTTKPKGIGLGLPLAKMLVDAHGGAIRVESAVGQGSTFIVELPLDGQGEEHEPDVS